jgi:hypothetical protein
MVPSEVQGMMDYKSMENSHDDRSEEDERL